MQRLRGRKPRGGREEERKPEKEGTQTEGGGAEEGPRGGETPWGRRGRDSPGAGLRNTRCHSHTAALPEPERGRSPQTPPEVGNWGAGAGQSGLRCGEGEG